MSPGDVNRRDLPVPFGVLAETSDQSCHDQAGVIHLHPERNEVAVRPHLFGMGRQVENCLLLFLREHRTTRQSVQKALEVCAVRVGHECVPSLQAGASQDLSATEACGH